ncbi:MAG TPA: hypothetical protein VFX02_09915 [Gammaproteobacteria bacterium]|nr:hypothetical protein [Gammaproteobacteria bacterium]
MFQLSAKPQSVGKVLDESIRLFFASFKHVFILSLIGTLAIMTPNFLMNEAMSGMEGGDPTQVLAVLSQYFAWFVGGMLVFIVFNNAMIYSIDRISHGQESIAGESLTVGFKKLLLVILAFIFYFLAVVGGFILLIIPGLILTLSLFLYTPLVVCRDLGPVGALKTSHNLIWGNWWRTAAVFTVPLFVMIILGILVAMVAGVVAAMIDMPGTDTLGGRAAVNQVTNVGMTLFYILMYPYFSSLLLTQLNDLKLRKQGSDLEARVTAA